MATAASEADLRSVLPRVRVPCLYIHGDRDVRAPRAVADAISAQIPSCQLVVVLPGAGHAASVEAPDAVSNSW